MQAPPYNRSNAFSQDERNNVGGRSSVRTDQVDDELDAVSVSVNALRANQVLLQRDDGQLRDQSVGLYTLTPSARAALQTRFNPRGLWAALTAYAASDFVDVGGSAYVCAIAHTSGASFAADYAAGRWQVVAPTINAQGLAFQSTPTVPATDVQLAVTQTRSAVDPQIATFFGGL